MFSQSCNCLPNKKQSFFSNQPHHNMGLLRSLSSKSFHDSADHFGFSMNFETTKKNNLSGGVSSRTNLKLMNLVYSLQEARQYIPAFSVSTERSKINSKDLVTHYNTMTTSPLVQSYLVGGFVGSKSQLGRRRKNNIGQINLWDIIRDLVDVVGSPSANYPCKQSHNLSSSFIKQFGDMQESSKVTETSHHDNSHTLNRHENPLVSPKQSYADVAKRPMKVQSSTMNRQSEGDPNSTSPERCDTQVSVIEPSLSCNRTGFTNRDRITSECSADSEDSFIVFECSEDDNVDRDIYISDDETLSCFDEVSQTDSGIVPSASSSVCSKQSSKKVRFADEKSLVKVHPMVTWEYAYRMARRGPWETMARDSERFRLRIARTEAELAPVLDPRHRDRVYRQRFCDSAPPRPRLPSALL